MAMIDKIERESSFFSGESYKVVLSCGHSIKADRQPKVRVGDQFTCPSC